MPFFFSIFAKSRESVLSLSLTQFHQVIMATFEAGWCLKGCGSPRERGKKIDKRLRVFSTPFEAHRKISKVHCYYSLLYGTRHGLRQKTHPQRS